MMCADCGFTLLYDNNEERKETIKDDGERKKDKAENSMRILCKKIERKKENKKCL